MAKATCPEARETLARNIKRHLIDNALSETELARRAGVSQKHINNATNQRTSSSIEVVERIGQALMIPGWALMMPGVHDEHAPDVTRLAHLVACWIGSDESGRRLLETTARRLASSSVKK
jgi:transcriptional regulator with XRE-family HTH domain